MKGGVSLNADTVAQIAVLINYIMSDKVSWGTHEFTVYVPSRTTWNDVAGIYIFCGLNSQGQWVALYIGQADSFRTRIPQHERWNEAVRLGATHIQAMVVPLVANRDRIEQALIRLYQPSLNVYHKQTTGS
jgi:hypothetical protein